MAAVSPLVSPQDAAFSGLYERHADRVFGYCLRWLRSREEAEEAAQTTFLHAWRALGRGTSPTFEVAWLLAIARNVCRNRNEVARRRSVEVAHDPHVLEDTVEAPQGLLRLEGLPEALAGLSEQQRRALLLREWQGLSYREIADELGLSQSAVETLLFRARRALAARLRQTFGIGSAAPWLKSLFGGAAAKTAAAGTAALAVATATGIVVVSNDRQGAPAPAPAPRAVVVTAKPAARTSQGGRTGRVVQQRTHGAAGTAPTAAPQPQADGLPPATAAAAPAPAPVEPPSHTAPKGEAPHGSPAAPVGPAVAPAAEAAAGVVETATGTAEGAVATVGDTVAPVVEAVQTTLAPVVQAVQTTTSGLPVSLPPPPKLLP